MRGEYLQDAASAGVSGVKAGGDISRHCGRTALISSSPNYTAPPTPTQLLIDQLKVAANLCWQKITYLLHSCGSSSNSKASARDISSKQLNQSVHQLVANYNFTSDLLLKLFGEF